MKANEEWRPVLEYEGFYEVSSLGRIRSLDRFVTSRDDRNKPVEGRIMKQTVDADGYMKISISKNGAKFYTGIHRLMAFAFLDGYEEGFVVDHIDGSKTNNVLSNLEWVTVYENTIRGFATICRLSLPFHRAAFTRQCAEEIRMLHNDRGYSQKDLSKEFMVCPTTINNVIHKLKYAYGKSRT